MTKLSELTCNDACDIQLGRNMFLNVLDISDVYFLDTI